MVAKIIIKKLEGHLNKEEEIQFEKWLSENDENFLTFQRLKKIHREYLSLPDIESLDPHEAWQLILNWQKNYEQKDSRFFQGFLLRYAAIFIGLLGIFVLYKLVNQEQLTPPQPDPTAIILELGNGERHILSQKGNSKIINPNGNLVGEKVDGTVDYSQNEINGNDIAALEYNTIHIPNGRTFKVILSDGTVVNLNSGSTLRYPVKFIGKENRQVTLTGEAFFDVHKDENSPFIVTSGALNIRVLGTKFNASSYPEDALQNTVLVEGSVRLYEFGTVYNEDDSRLLYPGDMAEWQVANKTMSIKKVNTDLYTGWIEGKLVMKKMNFSQIIQRLQRHFNVKINNEYEELNDRIFTATFVTETIEEVLETFKIETPFKYEINGNEIHIYKQLTNIEDKPMEQKL